MKTSNQFLFIGILIISLVVVPHLFGSTRSSQAPQTTSTPDWYFCAVGDITSKTVRDAMKKLDCKAHVLMGDFYGKEKDFVAGFKENPNIIPVIPAVGNHDKCDNVVKADNIKNNKCTYGLKVKNIGFIVVNNNAKINGQVAEVERLFKKFQADPTIDFIVVEQHKNAVTNEDAHHGEAEVSGDRELYTEMANKYPKFQLLLQGHNHNYLECHPEDLGIPVVTDGTGGRKPYPLGDSMDDKCQNGLSGSKYNGFTKVEVTPQGLVFQHIVAK